MPDNRSAAEKIFAQLTSTSSLSAPPDIRFDWAHAIRKLLDDGVIMYVDPAEKHKVEFTDDGWFIMHPLTCRRESGSLFGCDFTAVASDQFRDLHYRKLLGCWEMELTGDGDIRLLDKADR